MDLKEKISSMLAGLSDALHLSAAGAAQGQNPELFHAVLVWAAALCVILFFMMGIDKRKARNGRYRISEKSLFVMALLGGALGGWLGMRVFRHKTRHWYFRLFFPLITLVWAAALIYLKTICA